MENLLIDNVNPEDIQLWDEEVEHEGDVFKVKYFDNGNRLYHCPQNKRGFKLTLRVGGTEEKNKEAQEAIKRFYVNNML